MGKNKSHKKPDYKRRKQAYKKRRSRIDLFLASLGADEYKRLCILAWQKGK